MRYLRLALVVVAICLAGRLCYFSEPFGVSVDESTYLAMSEVLNSGGVLYKDVVDRKPPALIWTYQFISKVFGQWNIHAVHFVFFVMILFLAYLAGLVLKRVGESAESSRRAVLLFAIYSSCFPREILSANAEIPMLIFLALSLLAFLKGSQERNNLWIFVSALLAAASCFFKQYGILIYAPIYVGWVLYERRTLGFWRKHLTAFVGVVSGFGLVVGIVSLYFVSQNAWAEFLRYFALDGLRYVASSRLVQNHATSAWGAIFGMLGSWPLLWWSVVQALRQSISWERWILILGTLGSLATVFLSGRYYTHYFIPVIWFLCLLAPGVLQSVWSKRKLWVLALVVPPFTFYAWFNLERERVSEKWSFTREKQAKIRSLGAWIGENSDPKDRLVVWGMASQIYVLAERGSGTRFVFADFISGRQPGYRSEVSIPTPGTTEEFLSDLRDKRPRFFIDTSSADLNDYQWFPPSRFSELFAFLNNDYQKKADIAGFGVWERKSGS